jgi:Rod binding domain-containing protein
LSINPPSDIVLGVANAADPQKLREAAAQLARAGGGVPAGADVVSSAAAPSAAARMTAAQAAKPAFAPPPAAFQSQVAKPLAKTGAKPEAEAYKKFEAYMLQTFVESMLPKDAPNVFGSGPAGNIWRSMLAEHLANEIARGTSFGIAEQIAKHREQKDKANPSAVTSPKAAAALSGKSSDGYMAHLQSLLTAEAQAAQGEPSNGTVATAVKG